MKQVVKPQPLNPAQVMVLQVLKEQYSQQDLDELREILLDFNDRKMQQHLDQTIAQKQYSSTDFENMLHGHDRRKS